MALTRIVDTDDSGSGTDGTIHNNAWLQTLNNSIDGRWSQITTTATGSQHNLSITSSSIEADVLRCNNASDLTITGIAAPASPAKPGKRLIIISVGAGHVFLANQNGSSSAANRLINHATSADTPLAAGSGKAVYVYDASVGGEAWRLVQHEQGAAITPTFADSHYTGGTVDADWALASGDRVTQSYILRGRHLLVTWYLSTTSVSNTPATLRITSAAWGGFNPAKSKIVPTLYDDNGGGFAVGKADIGVTSATDIAIAKLSGSFTNSTNTTAAYGDIEFEVT